MSTRTTTRLLVAALVAAMGLPGGALAWDAPEQIDVNELQLDNRLPNGRNVQRRMKRPRNLNFRKGFGHGAPQIAGPAIHAPYTGPLTAEAIRTGIEDAVLFLSSQQTPDGLIPGGYVAGGPSALAALAMLAAGIDPNSDPTLRKLLDALLKVESDNTYVRGMTANVWEYALRKAPDDTRFRTALEADVKWLLAARNDVAWRYSSTSRDWDNSATQYAALGLWAAQRAGIETGDAVWDALAKHFRATQNDDGGWGYVNGSGSTLNMATAGLATLYLVFDHHYGRKGAWSQGQPSPFASGEARQVLDAIDRGLTWLATADGDKSAAYYLYGIERTAVAGGQRLLGGVDWFAEGAEMALRAQRADGAFPLGYSDVIGTSLTLLFLVHGGAPPAFAKLQYGEGEDWNLNPRDLANLTRRLWHAYERPLNWHVVSADAPVEAFEAPILFITGSKAATFTDAQVATLRQYVERGGTILAEPTDGSPAFRKSMVELQQRIWPPADFPAMTLELVPATDAVHLGASARGDAGPTGFVERLGRNAMVQSARGGPTPYAAGPYLSAASDGVRRVFYLSDSYLARAWQLDDADHVAFRVAMNLLFQSTAMRPLAGRFSEAIPEGEPAEPQDHVVRIGRVVHGVGRDWDAAAHAWDALRPHVRHGTGHNIRVEDMALDDSLDPQSTPLLHLTGRVALELRDDQKRALKAYVDGGGTVLVEAFGGSGAFTRSARAELEDLFGPLSPATEDDRFVFGLYRGGTDLTRGVGYNLAGRRALRRAGMTVDRLHLERARIGGRGAVIFSAHDLSAALAGVDVYGGAGYTPETARQVMTNLVALFLPPVEVAGG